MEGTSDSFGTIITQDNVKSYSALTVSIEKCKI